MINGSTVKRKLSELLTDFIFWFGQSSYWDSKKDPKFMLLGTLEAVLPKGKDSQLNISDGSIYTAVGSISGIKLGEDVFVGRGWLVCGNRKVLIR
jgi:hypothetical protein